MFGRLRRLGRAWVRPDLHRAEVQVDCVKVGSDYGGWRLAKGILPDRPLVYSFGIGEDLSFDLSAIKSFNCEVHAFDPTPRSIEWTKTQDIPPQLRIHPIGIGARDAEVEFFAPAKPGHVSFSAAPGPNQSSHPILAKTMRLDSIMRLLGHSGIDVLKLDIEGFEYDVIKDIVGGDAKPIQILVEFHHRMYSSSDSDTNLAVDRLRDWGYQIFYVSETGREYGFMNTQPN